MFIIYWTTQKIIHAWNMNLGFLTFYWLALRLSAHSQMISVVACLINIPQSFSNTFCLYLVEMKML